MNIGRKIIGLNLPLPFFYGDPLSYDRWRWISKSLSKKNKRNKLADLGCGVGTYVFALGNKGFNSIGFSYDEKDIEKANIRKRDFEMGNCSFEKLDLRILYKERKLKNSFDIAICSEVIEHIIDDKKLVEGISRILRNKGILFLTTPYDKNADRNPRVIKGVKEGEHVRKGYNKIILKEILEEKGLELKSVHYCSGILSQKAKIILNFISKKNYILGRIIILPIKSLLGIFDRPITKIFGADFASICIVANKKSL
jgi:2-polyprenyl-3-methyl-5-hydroxy-6-metoxy-1,4-benzoquinol methylase